MDQYRVERCGILDGSETRNRWFPVLGISLLVVSIVSGFCGDLAEQFPPPAKQKVDFSTDVLPLLMKRCIHCHGEKKQEAGLRLDNEKGAHAGGDGGPVIDVGKSGNSLLVKYISGVDPDLRMPPEGELLSSREVGLIRRWIDDGAVYPETMKVEGSSGKNHWSFKKISSPPLPEVRSSDWCRNPIDRFVLARLEAENVSPSPEADRTTLARRLYLDLLGLLPTPEQVDAFVNDSRENAYQLLVEELLSSPHFGERWGRHWLDLARYADSDGYEKDRVRPHAWQYRNWVIDSINRDQHFDEFTLEQLAGDLLPNATLTQQIATGFHRNTLTNTEGGVDQEEYRVAATVDRVNTLGGAWLGLTLGCAQCHSHKYDPISQREYYQLFACFNSIDEVNIPAPTPEESRLFAEAKPRFDVEHAKLVENLKQYEASSFPEKQREWERQAGSDVPLWIVEEPIEIRSSGGALFRRKSDGSLLVEGPEPETDEYTVFLETALSTVTGLRIEAIPDETLHKGSSSRGKSQEFVLSEVRISVAPDERKLRDQSQPVSIKLVTADFSSGSAEKMDLKSPELAIDGKPETGWSTAGANMTPHSMVLEFEQPQSFPSGTWISVSLSQQAGGTKTLGRLRFSLTNSPGRVTSNPMPDQVAWGLSISSDQRSAVHREAITKYFQTVDPEYVSLKRSVDEDAVKVPVLTQFQAQVVRERKEGRKTHILTRGDFLRPGAEVQGGVPTVLGLDMDMQTDHTRLAVAKWLVHPEHPLTARVTMNRWWKDLFGQPLVTTIEDFGTRGEAPTHPDLLDWLAAELIKRHWSRKGMIRLIVGSATYRQSSIYRPELQDRDPKNHWISRQNRYRVEAENVRDIVLAAGGLLNPQIGGPSVRPPLPEGVRELGYAGGHQWPVSEGAERYRRGMYIFLQRTVPYPMLTTFDAPESTTSCLRRERSNTPLQALTLLNDPVFFESAKALGVHGVKQYPQDVSNRVVWMFRRCVSRFPRAEEIQRLEGFYEEMRKLAGADVEGAKQIIGELPMSEQAPEGTSAEDLIASIGVARIVLNLEEFMVRE